MTKWHATKIGKFLKERDGRYDPTDKAVQRLKRLNKIDFSGEIHLSDKNSKTDMIIVEPGDLVISGINVSKGALAVYHGDEPIAATIHYSSYIFDETQIDIEYFKRFVKSQFFIQILKEQVKGGIKTEIKPKHFLPLEINLPNVDEQKEIVSFFNKIENEMIELSGEIDRQQAYLKKIRQQLLQEAIEGKLTAEWRKNNHKLISGGNHASKLLEKIKAEKDRLIKEGKMKKEKPLPPISDNEKPFDLPDGWVWCRIAETIMQYVDCPHATPKYIDKGKICLRSQNIVPNSLDLSDLSFVCEDEYVYRIKRLKPRKNDLVYIREGGRLGVAGIISTDKDVCLGQRLMLLRFFEQTTSFFIAMLFNAPQTFDQIVGKTMGSAAPHVNVKDIVAHTVPLPSIAEQQAIVERVAILMAMIDDLEKQVAERKDYSARLMQSVLREAFESKL
ncbi:MAG TPA: restriction endonuclease subunit S [Smithellaceae bacterium]|nr:restriction endonuclease subunit S [Smithellaceae bacterium]HPE07305.1 restriction endonuclease subunit S [Smithellaceae bacterium]HRY38225.1 restriction endonuclease subunit S [Smithellaceae bacterium]